MFSTGWDKGGVFSADVSSAEPRDDSNVLIERKFREFLENFRTPRSFVYREQLAANVNAKKFYLQLDMNDLASYNQSLASNLQNLPLIYFPLLEQTARNYARSFYSVPEESALLDPFDNFQVMLHYSHATASAVRDLTSEHVGKLVRIPGIIINASSVSCKPSYAYVMCRSCSSHRLVPVLSAFGGVSLPRTCLNSQGIKDSPCPIDPYFVVPEKSVCTDQQTLKLQESTDMIPVGELPRHVLLTVDRNLVNKVTPGSRIIVNGVFSIYQSKTLGGKAAAAAASAIRSPYVKVFGIELASAGEGSSALCMASSSLANAFFNETEEREMIELSKTKNLTKLFAASIAPSIFGNEDIKLALACLLFGGTRKFLPDGMRIRGDINVLLLGDPGVAKSQLLKFVEKVAPISVYTSGKGSSAAGLTASVIRDANTSEFYLEGGAMVLADGGVVCIDEFDKMNEEDRVAIHEAMEQQTISIAKAGITTILNSRCSVLAAANPLFGRYDEMKAPGDNIDFSSTILSRFDMIFIIRDEHDAEKDSTLAKHVLSVHMRHNLNQESPSAAADLSAANPNEIDIKRMKRYISYCKAKCAPRLTHGAAEKLASHYVAIRSELHTLESNSTERSSIPITVRQLEAIVRIAEALAKITLSPMATEEHVDEAIRLFRVSTMQAVLSGHSLEGMTRPDLVKQVEHIEKVLKERVAIGSTLAVKSLVKEMTDTKGFPEHSVLRCIDLMVKQEKLLLRSQQKLVTRVA